MSAKQSVFEHNLGRIVPAAILGGVIAGTLDVFNGAYIYNQTPDLVLKAIASGLQGAASFEGGIASVALGLLLQWLISICAALVYIVAGRRFQILLREPMVFGPIFGVGVFCVMHFIVVPLSRANSALPTPLAFSEDFLANLVFGLIIAAVAKWMLRAHPKPQ
jgi:uncharacterized membrane protein YagU involved in acid resistance